MKQILAEILKDIKPSSKEEKAVKDKADAVIKTINSGLRDAKAILGGSGIKGTWLRQANDIDIFVKYNYQKYKEKSGQLSSLLESHLKKKGKKIDKLHGSRDYFQIKEDGYTIEVVPILDIKDAKAAKNITDISPLHAIWVNKKGKNLKDDIRLLKQFCKASKIYGAESYIQGFSGYICEILIIYYKGFENLIKAAAKWKDNITIDVENHWKKKNILLELNRSKISSPLIIIDPVQKERNAAAAVSKENVGIFKRRAKEFLKKPSTDFFKIQPLDKGSLKKRAKDNILIMLEAVPKKGKVDVVGCKIVKAFEHIKAEFAKNDFKVLSQGWEWNKTAFIYFIIKKQQLSDYTEREGPPLSLKFHADKFKKAHKDTFIKNNRLYAKMQRQFKKPEDLIESLKGSQYIKEQVQELRWKG